MANSVLLPYTLESYGSVIHNKLKQVAVYTGIAETHTPAETAADLLISKIRSMNAAMGIPEKLAGIRREDIPMLAKFADKEGNPLYPVPVLMNAKELEKFYYQVMEETDGT